MSVDDLVIVVVGRGRVPAFFLVWVVVVVWARKVPWHSAGAFSVNVFVCLASTVAAPSAMVYLHWIVTRLVGVVVQHCFACACYSPVLQTPGRRRCCKSYEKNVAVEKMNEIHAEDQKV